jgi:hypothetical protein
VIDALRLSRASGAAIENLAGDDVEKLGRPRSIATAETATVEEPPDSSAL